MAEARSLADIKLDNAYKFGAGRYLQEAGALNLLGGEVAISTMKIPLTCFPKTRIPEEKSDFPTAAMPIRAT